MVGYVEPKVKKLTTFPFTAGTSLPITSEQETTVASRLSWFSWLHGHMSRLIRD